MLMFLIIKIVDLLVGILLFVVNHLNGFKRKFIFQLGKLKAGLSEEKKETKEMVRIYRRYMSGNATKEDLREANKQLRDLMKTMGLGVLLVLPFSFLTLPVLVKVGDRLGISIFPSAFSKDNEELVDVD